jgi:hypothetical protein
MDIQILIITRTKNGVLAIQILIKIMDKTF